MATITEAFNNLKNFVGLGSKKTKEVAKFSEKCVAQIEKFKADLLEKGFKFAATETTLSNGSVILFDPDTKTAMEVDPETGVSKWMPAAVYDLLDGTTLRVENPQSEIAGAIEELLPADGATPLAKQTATLATGETIEMGMNGEPVLINGEPAKEGDYVTTDGLTVRVGSDGMLIEALSKATTEMIETAGEMAAQAETLKAENDAMKAKYSALEKVNENNVAALKAAAGKTVPPPKNDDDKPANEKNKKDYYSKSIL